MKADWHAGKLNDIQWLRAIAALEVVAWHSDLITKNFSSLSVANFELYRPLGGMGVEVFFIVSGYVMCLRLPAYKSGAQFLCARFLRLAPMYWLFTSLVILVFVLHPAWRLNALNLDADTVLRSYLMLPQRHYPILGVGWTLEIEMMFYVQLALALSLCAALMRPLGNGIVYVLVAAGLIGFALGTWPNGRTWDYHLASPYMLMFAFGWMMCSAERGQTPGIRNKTFAAAVLVWIAALTITDPEHRHLLSRMALAAGVFVCIQALRPVLQRNVFINRAASMLGDASYSLYLSHWFILSGLGKAFGALHLPTALDPLARCAGASVAVLFALACFRYAENPLDRLLRPRVRRTTAPVRADDLPHALAGQVVVPFQPSMAGPDTMPSVQTQKDAGDGPWPPRGG